MRKSIVKWKTTNTATAVGALTDTGLTESLPVPRQTNPVLRVNTWQTDTNKISTYKLDKIIIPAPDRAIADVMLVSTVLNART